MATLKKHWLLIVIVFAGYWWFTHKQVAMSAWAQIIPGAQVLDGAIFTKDVGFQAHAVEIDNYTPYYLYLKDADAYIAPFWVGAIRVLSHTTDYAYVEVASPFGPQGIPIGTSYMIHLIWVDSKEVQSSPGTSLGGIGVSGGPVPPVNVNVTGGPVTVNVTGASFDQDFLTTILDVPVSPAAPIIIPTGILTLRKALMLQSSVLNDRLIYVGGPTVTADEASTGGAQLGPGQSFPIDTSIAIPYIISAGLRASGLNQKCIVIEGA